ncbi:MAG: hypothetical protein KDD14_22315 [Saprospiraceae bacterium]|nr:hypothetical protein [Saprospiraceae bacterium]
MNKKDKIYLLKYRGDGSRSFTGRKEGKSAREDSTLDSKDKDNVEYEIIIPMHTIAFNPSFFLGYLFKSIEFLGLDKFDEKYKFIFEDDNQEVVKQLKVDIEEGKRHAKNQITPHSGLMKFIRQR